MSDLLLNVSQTYVLMFISGKPLCEPRNCKAAYFNLCLLALNSDCYTGYWYNGFSDHAGDVFRTSRCTFFVNKLTFHVVYYNQGHNCPGFTRYLHNVQHISTTDPWQNLLDPRQITAYSPSTLMNIFEMKRGLSTYLLFYWTLCLWNRLLCQHFADSAVGRWEGWVGRIRKFYQKHTTLIPSFWPAMDIPLSSQSCFSACPAWPAWPVGPPVPVWCPELPV